MSWAHLPVVPVALPLAAGALLLLLDERRHALKAAITAAALLLLLVGGRIPSRRGPKRLASTV